GTANLSFARGRAGDGRVHRLFLERIVRTLVKLANVRVPEPRLVDLDEGAEQGQWRELLHCKLDCVRRRFEPPVFDRLPALAVARGQQFRRRTVTEFAHGLFLQTKPKTQFERSPCKLVLLVLK